MPVGSNADKCHTLSIQCTTELVQVRCGRGREEEARERAVGESATLPSPHRVVGPGSGYPVRRSLYSAHAVPMETQEFAGAILATAGVGLLAPLTRIEKHSETEERTGPDGLTRRYRVVQEEEIRFIPICWACICGSLVCWCVSFVAAITAAHARGCDLTWPSPLTYVGAIPYVLGMALTEWKERM